MLLHAASMHNAQSLAVVVSLACAGAISLALAVDPSPAQAQVATVESALRWSPWSRSSIGSSLELAPTGDDDRRGAAIVRHAAIDRARSVPAVGFDLEHAGQVTLGIGATGAGLGALLGLAALASGSGCDQSCGMLGEFIVVGLLGAGALTLLVGAILWAVGALDAASPPRTEASRSQLVWE